MQQEQIDGLVFLDRSLEKNYFVVGSTSNVTLGVRLNGEIVLDCHRTGQVVNFRECTGTSMTYAEIVQLASDVGKRNSQDLFRLTQERNKKPNAEVTEETLTYCRLRAEAIDRLDQLMLSAWAVV